MKSVVYSINRRNRRIKLFYPPLYKKFVSAKTFFTRYRLHILFLFTVLLGVVLGSLYEKTADTELLNRLDFLFITNMKARLDNTAFEVFCSFLASDFIFIFLTFLLGFSSWGLFVLPFICAFKGFGLGISSAYMFSEYALSGIGFYILVVLPGAVFFVLCLVAAAKEALLMSVAFFKTTLTVSLDTPLYKRIKAYLFRFFVISLFTLCSAFIEMLLWVIFANMFKFGSTP